MTPYLLLERKVRQTARGRVANILPTLKKSLLFDRKLLLLVFYSALIGAGTYTMAKAIPYWYSETVQSSALELELGLFWSALNLSAALFSSYAYKVERKINRLTFMTGIGLVVSLGFFGLGCVSQYPAIALLFLFYSCRGLATPILKNYINENTSSDVRATVLSVRMFLVYVMFAVLFPVMGWVGDLSNWGSALMVAGSYFALFSSAAIVIFYLVQKQKEKELMASVAQLDLTTD